MDKSLLCLVAESVASSDACRQKNDDETDDATLGYLDCGEYYPSSCFPKDRAEGTPCNWVKPDPYDPTVNPFLGYPGNAPYLDSVLMAPLTGTCGECEAYTYDDGQDDAANGHIKYGTCACCTKIDDESYQDASCNNSAGEIYDTGTYYKCITQDECNKKCPDTNQRQHWVWDAMCFNWMSECK